MTQCDDRATPAVPSIRNINGARQNVARFLFSAQTQIYNLSPTLYSEHELISLLKIYIDAPNSGSKVTTTPSNRV